MPRAALSEGQVHKSAVQITHRLTPQSQRNQGCFTGPYLGQKRSHISMPFQLPNILFQLLKKLLQHCIYKTEESFKRFNERILVQTNKIFLLLKMYNMLNLHNNSFWASFFLSLCLLTQTT